jgi:transcriptional regulator with XRE-family HTH domain
MKIDAHRLRDLRRKHGFSQEELARRVDLSYQTIARVERGFVVRRETLERIAQALQLPVEHLLGSEPEFSEQDTFQSVFISYGGPDENFARLLHDSLTARGVKAFFYPESALPGKRLHRTMVEAIYEYDRVLLLCSKSSLHRPGVLNEIEQILQREASEGGEELLIPLVLDDFLFVGWQPSRIDLRAQVTSRVVSDFRGALEAGPAFDARLNHLLRAIKTSGRAA